MPDDDDGPRLPQVRIGGVKLTTIVVVSGLVVGFFVAVRAFITYSTDEVTRAKTEVHDAFSR